MTNLLLITFISIFVFPTFGQWSDLNFPLTSDQVLTIVYEDNYILAGTDNESAILYRTSNHGANWEIAAAGLKGKRTNSLFVFNDNGTKLIYAATDSGSFVTADYGSNWSSLDIDSVNQSFNTIFRTDELILAGSDIAIYRSSNNGLTWQEITIDNTNPGAEEFELLGDDIYAMINAPTFDNIIYRSPDNGLTWEATNSDSLYFEVLSSIEVLDNKLYYMAYGRMYRTTNQGNSWEKIGTATWYPAVFTSYGDHLFIGGLAGVMYTFHKNSTQVNLITTPFSSSSAIDVNSGLIVIAGQDPSTSDYNIWTRSTSQVTSAEESSFSLNSYALDQNYPNPFNPSTKISWQSPVGSHQSLKVYDILGNEVATLVDDYKSAGSYEIEFDASGLSSGIYFYKLQSGNYVETKKMILIR